MPPRPTLFVSYRRGQLARVEIVVSLLRSANIDCFLDIHDIDPLAPVPDTIRAGIDRSHAFLAWWSVDYTESDHCLQEFRRAWQHARRQSSDLAHRLWILNPEVTANHVMAGELNAENFLKPPAPGTETFWASGLSERLQALLPEGPLADERTPEPVPLRFGVPSKSNEFTGRGRELISIHSKLHPAQTGVTGTAVALQTHGMGGIGKTELAAAYANDFAMAYPGGIHWLNLAGWIPSNPALESDAQSAWARALEQTIGIDTERARNLTRDHEGKALPPAAVRERLAKELGSGSHYLWILDNVPEVTPLDVRARILNFIRAPTANGRTLLTTRDGRVADGFAAEALDVLSEDDALRLLVRFRPDHARAELDAILRLVHEVGGHTQALILLGENARENIGGYPRVLDRLLETGKLNRIEQIANQLRPELGAKARGIVATFQLSIDPLGPDSKELLSLASVCAPNLAIPDGLLADSFGGESREDEFGVALAQLLRASLLTRRGDRRRAVLIHTLIAAATSQILDTDELTLRHRVADSLLKRISTAGDLRTHSAIADDIGQARELGRLLEELTGIEMNMWVYTYEYSRGNYSEASALATRNLLLAKRILGEEHHYTLYSMNNLASILRETGDLNGARTLNEQTLALCWRVLGAEHPQTLYSVNNLAATLCAQGDLSKARALQEQSVAIQRRILGEEHPDTQDSMIGLAATLYAQGDLSKARALQEQTLTVRRRLLGEDHPFTLDVMNTLAATLSAQGDLSGACALAEQTLTVRRRVLGEEHLATSQSMQNLAGTLRTQGNVSGARILLEQTLAVKRRVLGEEHPETLASMNNLAAILHDQGDLGGARTLHAQTLATRRNVLGEDHLDTLVSMHNLAGTLRDQGDLNAARVLLERALAIRRGVLGDEHTETTVSAWNLFLILLELNDYVAARTVWNTSLVWLLNRDANTFDAEQRKIREHVLEFEQSDISQPSDSSAI